MATQLKPGVSHALFARLAQEGVRRGRLALEPVALAIERQAKINLSANSHKYGTPTTATPGAGPGLISGNLRRSITHTPVKRTEVGWVTLIGTGVDFYPTYHTKKTVIRGKTPADVYGEILEVHGTRAGNTFPFLEPAFRFGVTIVAPIIYRDKYGSGWARLI